VTKITFFRAPTLKGGRWDVVILPVDRKGHDVNAADANLRAIRAVQVLQTVFVHYARHGGTEHGDVG
jgi:hypothetical protein